MLRYLPEFTIAAIIVMAIIWARVDATSDVKRDNELRAARDHSKAHEDITDALSDLPADPDAIRRQLRHLAQ
jgi:hypothetical protein